MLTFFITTVPYAYLGVVGGSGPSGILRYFGEKIHTSRQVMGFPGDMSDAQSPTDQAEPQACSSVLTILITSRIAKYFSVRSPASVSGAS